MGERLANLAEAVKNPPPQRLASVEYKSHFLQMLGVTVVCVILFIKGFWYIIFAFVFSLGISYSQGMTAYMKYKTIKALTPQEKPEDFDKDISPTRRRGKIIGHIYGDHIKWVVLTISVVITVALIDPNKPRWILMILYPSLFLISYIVLYFGILFKLAYPLYKDQMKGGTQK